MKKTGIIGVALVALAALLGLRNPSHFFQSYLIAFLFWMAIPLGSMALRMIHNMTGGGWGKPLDIFFEAAIRTMPLLAVFFIPMVFGFKTIYPWVHAAHGEHALKGFTAAYLTPSGFLLRAAICFAIWIGTSFILNAYSRKSRGREEAPGYVQGFSGVALVVYVITMTVASVDWAMSIEPHWYSTIYGALFMMGQGLSSFSFGVMFITFFASPAEKQAQLPDRIHDIGKLMLAFVMLWTYMVLSQFLIIWSGNLPEESVWYIVRFKGGWSPVGFLMMLFQFVLPFAMLLSRPLKRNPKTLSRVAAMLFLERFLELIWLIKPAFCPSVCLTLTDLMLWAGLGGIWIYVFFSQHEAVVRNS